jgi:hypothetical protein
MFRNILYQAQAAKLSQRSGNWKSHCLKIGHVNAAIQMPFG